MFLSNEQLVSTASSLVWFPENLEKEKQAIFSFTLSGMFPREINVHFCFSVEIIFLKKEAKERCQYIHFGEQVRCIPHGREPG